MYQHLWRPTDDGCICGGPQALPTNWRDKGDISDWSTKELRAEGWLPNMVNDQRKPGEIDAGWTDELREDCVIQTLHSRPAPERSIEEVTAEFKQRLFSLYDAKAAEKDYRDRDSVMLRAGYPGPYREEATLYAQWIDACDEHGYTVLAKAQSGGEIPSWEDFCSGLPKAPW